MLCLRGFKLYSRLVPCGLAYNKVNIQQTSAWFSF